MSRPVLTGLGWLALLLVSALVRPARAADTVVYYHTDALRSVAVVTNASGQVIERTHYAPYGQVLDRPLRDGPGYGGHEEDAATGLVYMQQRYYCPECGRFLSADPVGADPNRGGNFNRYWYANDNPYRFTDPDGRESGAGYATGEYTLALPPSSPEARDAALTMAGVVVVVGGAIGADEAVGVGVALRAGVRYVGAKIAGAVVRRAAADEAGQAAGGAAKSLKEQAADLVSQNGGKNRVTIESPSQKTEVDLAGKSHGGIETPHVKVSERNMNAPNQPTYNTKSAKVRPATQEDINMVKHHLEKNGQ